MIVQHTCLPPGQQQARTRWGTHESGEVFDRKKSPHLTEQAQKFMAQQALCVIAGLDTQDEVAGLLALSTPGFVQILDRYTCLLQLDGRLANTRVLQRLRQAHEQITRFGLFFISHPTRERLCVHGAAELLPHAAIDRPSQSHPSIWTRLQRLISIGARTTYPSQSHQLIWVRLHVTQSFFHCTKYIKTRIPGLTHPVRESPKQKWRLPYFSQSYISGEVRAFLAKQMLCYLCTVNQDGQCAVNHRGGSPGFLVALPPDATSRGGTILLPDYSGNGAFEAIGNIFETGRAALIIPDYAAQVAFCISGSAQVLELTELPAELAQRCVGAERVIALSVRRVEMQSGDWTATLAYEQARAASIPIASSPGSACPL